MKPSTIPTSVKILNDFWRRFCLASLYDAGYADPVNECGADTARTVLEAQLACSYMMGVARTARLASPYRGRNYNIAEIVALAAGMFLSCIEECRGEKLSALSEQYIREIEAEIANDSPDYQVVIFESSRRIVSVFNGAALSDAQSLALNLKASTGYDTRVEQRRGPVAPRVGEVLS